MKIYLKYNLLFYFFSREGIDHFYKYSTVIYVKILFFLNGIKNYVLFFESINRIYLGIDQIEDCRIEPNFNICLEF